MRLANKVALVTGGTSGIGTATAHLFSREGAKVALTGRSEERGRKIVDDIVAAGGEAIFIAMDVCLADDCKRAVVETLEAFDRVDVLFNNAGVWFPNDVPHCTEEEWDLNLDIMV